MSTEEILKVSNPEASERFKKKSEKIWKKQRDTLDRNPCHEEGQMVLRCLNKTSNAADCETYAANAANCRKFWKTIVKDRKRRGIDPALPVVEDRPKILEEYRDWVGK